MAHWLLKSEPSAYSWDQLVKDKRTSWTGVRNAQAAINLKAMKVGDRCFFYHSQAGKEIVGVAEVIGEHYRLAESIYDAKQCGILMRKFGIKYAACHPEHLAVRQAFARVRTQADWQAVLDTWYQVDLPGKYPDAEIDETVDCEIG